MTEWIEVARSIWIATINGHTAKVARPSGDPYYIAWLDGKRTNKDYESHYEAKYDVERDAWLKD